jgi:hypothetical protein
LARMSESEKKMKLTAIEHNTGDILIVRQHTDNERRLVFDVRGPRGAHKAFIELSEGQTEYFLGAMSGLDEELREA